MRPIKLKMTAFGSYAGETVIDFNKLGTDGLYLITGVTGAGKSTIFDAITYALYGELSDKEREAKMLRSEYADPTVDTVVELEFEYKGLKYTVKRNPTYMRQKKRGEGKSEQKAGAELILPNGKVLEKIPQVDAEIKNILGISKDQFKQTVMIAQGKFRELLTADTKTRKEILRSIFNAYIYKDFQDKINVKASSVKAEFEKQLGDLKNAAGSVRYGDNEELGALCDKVALGELTAVSELETMLGKQNSDDDSELEKLAKAQKTIDEKILKVTEYITKGEEQNKRRRALEEAREQLPEIKKTSDDKSQEAKDTEEKYSSENAEINKEIGALTADLPKYEQLESNRRKLRETETRITKNTDESNRLGALRDELQKEHAKLWEESVSLENAGVNIEKLNADIRDNKNRTEALSGLVKELKALDDVRKEYRRMQKEYSEARSDSDKLQSLAHDMRNMFNDEQAGLLAETLEDNKPCPVCGSLHHPDPKKKTEGAPSKKEVEAAEASAEKARQKADKLSSECSGKNSVIEEKKRVIGEDIADLLPGSTLDNANENAEKELGGIKAKTADLEKQLTLENKNLTRKNELSELLPKKQDEIDKLKNDLDELTAAIANDTGSRDRLREQIESEARSLRFAGRAEAEARISELDKQLEANKAVIYEANKEAREQLKRLQSLTAEIETHEKNLASETPIDVEENRCEMDALNAEKGVVDGKYLDINVRRIANREAAKKLADVSPKLKDAEQEYTLVRSLADTACGKLSGVKTDLEAYVQARFLDRILLCANRHLHKMSDGQYDLIRRENIDTAQGQHTLDLDVKDYYNGTQRDVKSLSGGESFLASLSLALGLSDAVQQSSGGVRLDAMFVDEGFGSLSPEYLDQAMSVLRSLTESNRIIGIISHVEEVKRKIPKRIEITKNGSKGSKAEIVLV